MNREEAKKPRRKYGKIKKNFVSVEEAKLESQKTKKAVEARMERINLIKSLKVETPWTTGSSDQEDNLMYYKIQQSKKCTTQDPKYSKINTFLDKMSITQLDFGSLLHETKFSDALLKKYNKGPKSKMLSKPSSLFMRRKLKM